LDAWKYDKSVDAINRIAEQSDFMSIGNIFDREVYIYQRWGLLQNLGLVSCVAPSLLNLRGEIGYAPFPMMMG
jgi:hypothetical protein